MIFKMVVEGASDDFLTEVIRELGQLGFNSPPKYSFRGLEVNSIEIDKRILLSMIISRVVMSPSKRDDNGITCELMFYYSNETLVAKAFERFKKLGLLVKTPQGLVEGLSSA